MRPVLPFAVTAVCALAPILTAGCGGKKKQDDLQSSPPGASGTAAATAAPATPLQEDDLASVCDGKPEARAKAYSKTAANVHSMAVFEAFGGEGAKFKKAYLTTLKAFNAAEPADTELVACVRRTSAKKVSTCDFDSTPPTRYLDMYEATFELSIREATTGAVVTTKSMTLAAGGCPMVHSFSSQRDDHYPDAENVLTELAAPILIPANATKLDFPNPDAVRDKLDDLVLQRVCLGIPEPRAAAYDKTPGKIAPTYVLERTGPASDFNRNYHPDFSSWKADDASQYQLVLCVTETSRTKKKECKFDDKEPAHLLDLYSGTHEATLREARTAKVLATKKINAPSDGVCPTIFYFHSTHDSDVEKNEKDLRTFARPFAEPK